MVVYTFLLWVHKVEDHSVYKMDFKGIHFIYRNDSKREKQAIQIETLLFPKSFLEKNNFPSPVILSIQISVQRNDWWTSTT